MGNLWLALGVAVGWVGVAVTPAQADRLELKRPKTERYTLDNGLRVVLQPDPRRAKVVVAMGYAVGSRDEPAGYRELAHLVEHLTYRGSRHLGAQEALTLIERSGGIANGFTAADHTVYYAEVPAEHLPRLLWIESERMAFTLEAMSEANFEIEQRVVRNELRERSSRADFVRELIMRTLYPSGHPYAHVGDRETDLDDLELDHARWFFQRYYRPKVATLVIAGRFDAAQVKPLVARYFAPVVGPAHAAVVAPRPAAKAVRIAGHERLMLRAPLTRGQLRLHWLVPCTELRCLAELVLLAEVLTQDGAAHLTQALYAAGVAVDAAVTVTTREQHAEVTLTVTLPGEATPLQALAVADRALAALAQDGLSASSLQATQYAYAATVLEAQQSPLARALGLATGDPDPLLLLNAVMELTPADVQTAVERYLPRYGRLEVLVTRDEHASPEGELEERIGALNPEVSP